MTHRQHPKVSLLQQQVLQARAQGDGDAEREALVQLLRIEIRTLNDEQRNAQALHIAAQCDGAAGGASAGA